MLAALALAAATPVAAEPKPSFFPPVHREPIAVIYDTQVPDPGANKFRLCEGRVCVDYHQRKAVGVTITLPLGKRHN